jgi:hypothetical protein
MSDELFSFFLFLQSRKRVKRKEILAAEIKRESVEKEINLLKVTNLLIQKAY